MPADNDQSKTVTIATNGVAKPALGSRKYLLIFILVLIVGAVGWLVYSRDNGNTTNKATGAKSSGNTSVDELTFQKPSDFAQTHKETIKDNTTATYDKSGSAYLGVSASKSSLAADQKYVDGIKYLMTYHTGADYDKYAGYFNDFVKSFIGPDYSIELGPPIAFTNSAIKDKAWTLEVKAQPSATKQVAPLSGQFIYIVGSKGFYYFSLLTTDYDWVHESSTWHQITDSVKIGQ